MDRFLNGLTNNASTLKIGNTSALTITAIGFTENLFILMVLMLTCILGSLFLSYLEDVRNKKQRQFVSFYFKKGIVALLLGLVSSFLGYYFNPSYILLGVLVAGLISYDLELFRKLIERRFKK